MHTSMTCSGSIGAQNDGHPVPESNFASDENSGSPPMALTHSPSFLLSCEYPASRRDSQNPKAMWGRSKQTPCICVPQTLRVAVRYHLTFCQ